LTFRSISSNNSEVLCVFSPEDRSDFCIEVGSLSARRPVSGTLSLNSEDPFAGFPLKTVVLFLEALPDKDLLRRFFSRLVFV